MKNSSSLEILFDNYSVCNECQSLWGFSGYLPEYKLLFDTGSNGRVLLKNMEQLGVDIQAVEYLFITHSHWDHIGGLDSVIELNPNITIFAPSSLSKHLLRDLKSMVHEVVICGKKPQYLFANLHTTGLLGTQMPEHSLCIEHEKSIDIITGCGHFGIENIAQKAQEYLGKRVQGVYGGFHLMYEDEQKILKTIACLKELGVEYAHATHCSGDRAIELFEQHFRKDSH